MEKKQSLPLTEDEIKSVYRNEFFPIDKPRYFNHECTGGKYNQRKKIKTDKNTFGIK